MVKSISRLGINLPVSPSRVYSAQCPMWWLGQVGAQGVADEKDGSG